SRRYLPTRTHATRIYSPEGSMTCRSNIACVIFLVILGMPVSFAANAQNAGQNYGMGFRSGVWTGSVDDCSRKAMAALSSAGFSQNLQILNGQPPSLVATGSDTNGHIAMVVCAQKGDLVTIVSGPGNVDPILVGVVTKLYALIPK